MAQSAELKGKKTILLFGSLDMGGAERQGLVLARYLQEHEQAEVQVWGLGPQRGAVADQCDAWGLAWRAVPVHWGLRRRLPQLVRLLRALRAEQPAILLSYTKVPNLAAALLWRFSGIRLCVWNQADAGLLLPATLFHRLAIRQVHYFIANAEGGQRYLVDTFGLMPEQVRLIRNGVVLAPPVHDRASWRQYLEVGDNTGVAVMVANLSRYKDHATLLRSWQQVRAHCTQGALPVLALAGRFDDQATVLQQLARQLGISEQVRFLGPVTDVSGLLAAADLCVHSSPSEGIPNAVLEAMASGLPVAGSDIPGLREAVGDEGVPFLATVGDATALAEQIRRLLDNPTLRCQQGKAMRQRAAQLFSMERMCRETVAVLQAALGECR